MKKYLLIFGSIGIALAVYFITIHITPLITVGRGLSTIVVVNDDQYLITANNSVYEWQAQVLTPILNDHVTDSIVLNERIVYIANGVLLKSFDRRTNDNTTIFQAEPQQYLDHVHANSHHTRLLVTARDANRHRPTQIIILDVATGNILQRLDARIDKSLTRPSEPDSVNAIAWHPSGRLIAVSYPTVIEIWDIVDGRIVYMTDTQIDSDQFTLAWSHTGAFLLQGTHLFAFDQHSLTLMREFSGPQDRAISSAWSPDDTMISIGTGSYQEPNMRLRDSTVYVWEAATGKLMQRFSAHDAIVRSVVFSLDGASIISGDSDGVIYYWTIAQ